MKGIIYDAHITRSKHTFPTHCGSEKDFNPVNCGDYDTYVIYIPSFENAFKINSCFKIL